MRKLLIACGCLALLTSHLAADERLTGGVPLPDLPAITPGPAETSADQTPVAPVRPRGIQRLTAAKPSAASADTTEPQAAEPKPATPKPIAPKLKKDGSSKAVPKKELTSREKVLNKNHRMRQRRNPQGKDSYRLIFGGGF